MFGTNVDETHTPHIVEHATRIALIIGDIIVLILTWMKTYWNAREALNMHMKVRLTTLVLRDGICSQDCCHTTGVSYWPIFDSLGTLYFW